LLGENKISVLCAGALILQTKNEDDPVEKKIKINWSYILAKFRQLPRPIHISVIFKKLHEKLARRV
jgi:hypothetical protein